MNAQSAPNPSKGGKGGAQNQLTLDGAAPSVLSTLSARAGGVMPMATGLKLSIDLHIQGDEQWLRMSLEDEMNLTDLTLDCPILCTTPQKRYHLEEATVIGMRRLMDAAFSEGMISDSPGELMTVWKSPPVPVAPMPTPLEDLSQSLTDLESL